MRLRLIFSGILTLNVLICAGCFTIDIRTDLNRHGGGQRRYSVTLDPIMSRLYQGMKNGGKLLQLPGQGLDKKPGVELLSQRMAETAEGGLELEWIYQASEMDLFSSGQDSIWVTTQKRGIWIYRTYREKIFPMGGLGRNEFQVPSGCRIKHILFMPGQVIKHNADSQTIGRLVWNRLLDKDSSQTVNMSATSREFNSIYLITLFLIGLLVVAAVPLFLSYLSNRPGEPGYDK